MIDLSLTAIPGVGSSSLDWAATEAEALSAGRTASVIRTRRDLRGERRDWRGEDWSASTGLTGRQRLHTPLPVGLPNRHVLVTFSRFAARSPRMLWVGNANVALRDRPVLRQNLVREDGKRGFMRDDRFLQFSARLPSRRR
jgi:hypothetical protein